jgi:antitoxin ParD1/3/4
MARNTSITLGEHFDNFINRQVSDGRFGSASEVVRAGLRLLEENETKLVLLREALHEGEKSGFVDYSYDSIVAELDETTVGE